MLSDYYDIQLKDFEQDFFDLQETVGQIKQPDFKVLPYFHTVYANGERAGIVGYYPASLPDIGNVEIILSPEFRGKGLIAKIYDKLAEEHRLKVLYATINKRNMVSLSAHEKIGFKRLSEEKQIQLRERRIIKEGEIRLEKNI
ncbi:MAG: GNAT family N-acetyltransferase [Candidatus Paceibacterota bacterium]|jgi:RimJ/RimL family protein N-acetyltransferase